MQNNLLASSGNCEQVLGWEDGLNCVAEHSPGKLLNHKPLETGRVSGASIIMCLSSSYTLPQAAAIGCYWNWDPRRAATWVWPCSYSSILYVKFLVWKREVILLFTVTGILCSRWQCELLLIPSNPLAVNLSSLSTIPGVYLNPSFFLHEVDQNKGLLALSYCFLNTLF